MERLTLITALLCGVALAQRLGNATICDYYAIQRYGANTSTSQSQLIQDVVALAFGGGMNFTEYAPVTGILNAGTYDYNGQIIPVDLRPWFNGSIDSSNLNGNPTGIDWLDGGGLDPLYDYLSNKTATVVIANTTNQQ